MVSSIGSSMQRPDPSQMANKLFAKLDTKNQGYIEKSDLQSAFNQISGSSSSGNAASVDEVFKQLDGNSDGKITKDEMSSGMQKLADQLDSQFNSMRTSGKGGQGMGGMQGMGSMPPPPPPSSGKSDSGDGLTKDQLTSISKETGSTDSKLTNLVKNFEKADTNQDGKVSMQEAMAYDQTNQTSASTSASTESSSTKNTEAKVMLKIMQLMQAYGLEQDSSQASSTGTLSVSA